MGESARNTRQRPRRHPRQPRASSAEDIGLAMLAAVADGVVAIDDRGVIRFGNNAAAQLLGLPADDVAGLPSATR